jgi:hypothetical protein
MKLKQLIITLSISLFSNFTMSQSLDSIPSSKGVNITDNIESIHIPISSELIIRTDTNKYYGTLDSVAVGELFVDGQSIKIEDIETIKFLSSKRKKKGLIYLISAPVSFAAGIGAFSLYWNSGHDGLDWVALGLWLYSPVALVKGTVLLLKKKKYKTSRGWVITIVN